MNTNDIKAFLISKHTDPKNISGMAWECWEDGEITLTKCSNGELYGQRNLHLIVYGDPDKAIPKDLFPNQNSKHGCISTDSEAIAKAVRNFIFTVTLE